MGFSEITRQSRATRLSPFGMMELECFGNLRKADPVY